MRIADTPRQISGAVALLLLLLSGCWQGGETAESAGGVGQGPANVQGSTAAGKNGGDTTAPAKVGSKLRAAPDFELKDSSGKVHRLSEFRGQPLVLHFWASWCPPCVDELPQWIETAKSFDGRPLKWLAVSLDANWEDAHKILQEKALPGNVVAVLDPDQKSAESMGSFQFPESYLISADQKIAMKWVGAQNWSLRKAEIEKALK